jgi:hypothetical protein
MTRGCLRVISLTSELLRYTPSVQLQERLVAERKAGTAPDTVLVVQVGTDKESIDTGQNCALCYVLDYFIVNQIELCTASRRVAKLQLLCCAHCAVLLSCSTILSLPLASEGLTKTS